MDKELLDFEVVALKLKNLFGVRTDGELAKALNITRHAYACFKIRRTLPFKRILSTCKRRGVSVDLVFTPETITARSEAPSVEKRGLE
ncbi:MAG: hypothetical protein LBQ52_04585 [Helicobacteraceae bacterium]|jgi:hypothetical protein|nr:hypothetical protein [Helicobacteraceae bacterium]